MTNTYDNYLDESYGTVNIAGNEYPTSQALKEVDPTAYRVGEADWYDYIEDAKE